MPVELVSVPVPSTRVIAPAESIATTRACTCTPLSWDRTRTCARAARPAQSSHVILGMTGLGTVIHTSDAFETNCWPSPPNG